MRYNTKFAFLAVAVLCATTFALPLPRNAGSIVAREVNNDISAREFHDMYLKARAVTNGDGDDSSAPHHHHHHRHHHHHTQESTDPKPTDSEPDAREDKPGDVERKVHNLDDDVKRKVDDVDDVVKHKVDDVVKHKVDDVGDDVDDAKRKVHSAFHRL